MNIDQLVKRIRWLVRVATLAIILLMISATLLISGVSIFPLGEKEVATIPQNPDLIENGIHVATGLVEGKGLKVVIGSCTACHSAKLITQNRATREGWISIIRWMQDTQNLWDLGESEELIVAYLAEHYAPTKKGRRANLENIEWYELEK